MDTDSLSFGYEEHFPVFESSDFLNIDDESESMEDAFDSSSANNIWEWEVERELNGDVALIPMSSEVGMDYLSHSPPIKEDFQKIMSEWQHFMNIEVPGIEELSTNAPLSEDEEENITYYADVLPNPIPPSPTACTIAGNSLERKIKSTGKKIDMNAQCYILEEDDKTILPKVEPPDSDTDDEVGYVEPKTEEIDILYNDNINVFYPKLELPDLETLDPTEFNPEVDSRQRSDSENDFVDVDTISNHDTPILQAGDLNSLLEQFEATETPHYFEPAAQQPPAGDELFELPPPPKPDLTSIACVEPPKPKILKEDSSLAACVEPAKPQLLKEDVAPAEVQVEPSTSQMNMKDEHESSRDESDKKQILDALPQELIMRIKASSKRRMISVIDPIPSKRRGIKKPQMEVQQAPQPPQEKVEPVAIPESIQLDHDYCGLSTPYPKHPKKDSGFESAEEDEQRSILRNQPTVKGANGKLMVSLLKVNTIRSSIAAEAAIKKKRKLNLEEYKKRREGIPRSCDDSQSNSPDNSGRSSPTIVEDENMRLLKHQQKLMQMAEEVLKTPPKKSKPASPAAPTDAVPTLENFTVPPPPRIPPNNIEVKILVSIGVNTDGDLSRSSKELDVPVTELEEIKPLLKSANAKINNNSLITSVIENLQNKKKVQDASATVVQSQAEKKTNQPKQPHGEDKTIVYRDKDRPAVATNSVEVQTDAVAEVEINQFKRRHNSSSSSSDHRKLCRRRSSSNESHSSYSSQTSMSSSSSSRRTRSRSPSPRRLITKKRPVIGERDRVREVEERRIVYVGGLSPTMSKEGLRNRFLQYGPISNVSVHFREYGDNYGFVTFQYKVDAYEAVEHGNDDPTLPAYDLSFGGRRIFCRTHYADLDNMQDELGYGSSQGDDSFDNLLREAKAKMRKRKTCT